MISQLLTIIIVIILAITLINQFKHTPHYNKTEEEKSPSLTPDLTYKEAEMLLSSPAMEENHIILNENLLSLNESLKLIENIRLNLSLIPINSNYTLPTFLSNNYTNSSLNIAKNDFELYFSKYVQLSKKTNHITESTSQLFKNFSKYFNDIKREMDKIYSDFEIFSKNLCLPLILNGQKIDNNTTNKLRRLDDLIQDYKDTVNQLGELMNGYFDFCKISFEKIRINIEDISNNEILMKTQVEEAFLKYKDILNSTDEGNLHDNLLLSKKTFIELKSEMIENQENFSDICQNFEHTYNNIDFIFEDFESNYNETVDNLKIIHNSIMEETLKKDIDKYYPNDLIVPPIKNLDLIISIKDLYNLIIKSQNSINSEMEETINTINVEAKTSLDLLFIMDITGSMNIFIDEAKNNLINIINRIISECPGININLGFIGYRDIEEFSIGDYSDIDFTQNYEYVQEVIEGVWAYGGGDFPEDIAGAFEMTLNKTWTSNARFAILVADAPCHGEICYSGFYYDDYPDGIPGRRNITDLVEELAENQISLFCMRIRAETEKMFELFKSIYQKYKNVEFHLEGDYTEKDFSDTIVESASKVYVNQRNIDIEYPYLKNEASNILNKLFGISFDFSLTLYEVEIIVSIVPKITVTLSESCDVEIKEGNKYYYIEIENGLTIGDKGSLDINFAFNYLDNIFNLTEEFKQRFNGVINKGQIIFEFTGKALKISFVLSYSIDKLDKLTCDGTVAITIEPPKPALEPEYAYNEVKEPETNLFSSVKEGFGEILSFIDNSVQKIYSGVKEFPKKVYSFLESSLESIKLPDPVVLTPAVIVTVLVSILLILLSVA